VNQPGRLLWKWAVAGFDPSIDKTLSRRPEG